MRTRAGLIVESRTNMSWFWSFVQQLHNLITSSYYQLSNPLYIYPFSGILTQLQVSIVFIEKINDLLVVDFQEGASDDEVDSFRSFLVDAIE